MMAMLRPLSAHTWRVVLAVGLGAAVIGSNMGLLAAAAYLIAAAALTHLMALLIIPMYAVRVLSTSRATARYAERLVSHRITFDILAQLRVRLFDRLRVLGPAGMQGRRSGDALGRVMVDVETLQNAYLLLVSPALVALLVSAALVGILLGFSGALAWAMLGFLLAGVVVLPLTVAALAGRAGQTLVGTRAALHVHLVDGIQGSRDVLSNAAGGRYLDRTVTHGHHAARAERRLGTVRAGREAAIEMLTGLAMLTALALSIPLVRHDALAGVYLAVPALLTLAAFEGIRPLGQAAETMSGSKAAAERVRTIGADMRGVSEPEAPIPLCPPFSLAFEDVSLDYGGSRRPAVSGVSFEVLEGSRVALVGPSGAGKTTLVRLLIRAWDPTEGRILIANQDIRRYSLRDLRATLGVVSQDTYIFDDTVRGNLLLSRPGASTGDLEEALHAAGLLDLVRGLPQGLDTWVGEHGEHLSGGERQRLAVARVLLQDSPIVLLDEVTANLDPLGERALLDTLYRVTEGRTVVTITHRLVGLARMDEILVLDRGRVVERGMHGSLSSVGGLYGKMLDIQENMLAV